MVWLECGNDPKPPKRKDVGKEGRRIRLTTNWFPVTVRNTSKEVIHYDVSITEPGKSEEASSSDPKTKRRGIPKAKRMRIFEAMKKQHASVFSKFELAFDSEKNAYSVSRIPQMKKGFQCEVELLDPETKRKDKYTVTLNIVNHAYLRDLKTAIEGGYGRPSEYHNSLFQMLEVMFQHYPANWYQRVGRNTFYSCEGEFGNLISLGGGKEGVVGFFSSLKPCQWKDGSLLLNIDISHTAFYKEQSVLSYLKETLHFRDNDFGGPLNPDNQRRVLKSLKGLKVQVTHTPICRTYKVTDVTHLGANRQTFPLTDPETQAVSQCTVEKYFQMQYNKRLQWPALNCLKVGPQNRNIYIPMEICKIAKGQKVNKKLSDDEMGRLIRETAKPPWQRLRSVCEIVKTQNFSNDPMIKSLEFTVADRPMELDGRVLPPPQLKMNEEFFPNNGSWDPRNRTFYTGATINSWVVMNYEPKNINKEVLWKFLTLLRNMARERGMSLAQPVIREIYRTPSPETEFLEVKQRIPNVEMIMVVLPRYGDIYGRVKRTGDREINVVSQCVKYENVRRAAPATVGNILLKINAKMGGTNNVLGVVAQPVVFTTPVMIMGADVNHPPAGDDSTPSLAAVVASMDRFASKYAVEVRHQRHRTEMIQAMKEMTKNLLIAFRKATNRKPERIVMYRDGVGESQFIEVLSYELKAMRAACTELHADYKPAITFLVVQKRHHTRLFCQERDGVGKSKNIPPGTTVDTAITHPTERDFFLCSHQGIQGTSRPSHYHVLWDDSDMTMDQLQKLTYAMCHLYSRCTKSISIPAPAGYAHLAAFRAKTYIQDLCHSETSSLASGGGEPPTDAVMAKACRTGTGSGDDIFKKLYYV